MTTYKAINYTSMFTMPRSIQLKFLYKRRIIVLPWRISFQQIGIFLASFYVSKWLFFPLLRCVTTVFGLVLFDYLGLFAMSAGLTYLFVHLPLEGKRIDQYLRDIVSYYVMVIFPKKVLYKGKYRIFEKRPAIFVVTYL